MNHCIRLTVCTAALTAASLTALGQNRERTHERAKSPANAEIRPGVDFRSSRWLDDRSIINDQGDKIAAMSDLILDRGSGRIEYLVVRTGTHMGLGGKTIALPYASVRWDSKNENFLLTATEEQLKTYPEFEAKDWSAMMESKDTARGTLWERLTSDTVKITDPYAGSLDTSKTSRIEGEIKKVERIRTGSAGEQVVLTVAANDGSTHRIALGPSWFINGSALVPMRGDKISVETLGLNREGDHMVVATVMRSGERETRLRGSDGAPLWSVATVETDGKTYATPYWRYLLLSSLRGMKVYCRADECGKVNDVILDRASGEIGFLSIDPDQHFLGIADTKRLIPWTVATVALEGIVRVDASKEMVVNSLETPSDPTKLNDGPTAMMAYRAFQVSPPNFEAPSSPMSANPPDTGDAWAAHGPVMGAIDMHSAKTVSGRVDEVTEMKFTGGIPPARALEIKSGESKQIVLLGPAWYIDNQNLACKEGDDVTAEVVRTIINGKPYWMAQTLDVRGAKVVFIRPGNVPAWDSQSK